MRIYRLRRPHTYCLFKLDVVGYEFVNNSLGVYMTRECNVILNDNNIEKGIYIYIWICLCV